MHTHRYTIDEIKVTYDDRFGDEAEMRVTLNADKDLYDVWTNSEDGDQRVVLSVQDVAALLEAHRLFEGGR